MAVTLYLHEGGHPALRLCDPYAPCPPAGGYDPALLDWVPRPILLAGEEETALVAGLRCPAEEFETADRQIEAGGGSEGDVGHHRPRRITPHRKKVEEARQIVSEAEGGASLIAVKAALASVAPVLIDEGAIQLQARLETLRMQADALIQEARDRAAWQMQLAVASVLMEFRLLMASIEALWLDDEDAILTLLLA